MGEEPKVYVIDDDRDLRESLRWLLESAGLTAEGFESAEAFWAAYSAGLAGCVLLDVRLPGMDGLRLLERLEAERAHLPVIIFTGHGEVSMAVRALKSGAFDFLEKPANPQRLLDCLQRALAADRERRARALERQAFERLLAQLTQREKEILEHIVAGQSSKAIALALGISERTVEKHRESLMHKMQARSLAQLIRLVVGQQAT
ncbi:response regulator transcription factor [Candidatus Methylocalor cossyra]|uniref:Transcriptional regulatory protein FixJ n=1 Tax=Candidatus Methylocalor cossyra TaxID=3108543 RepID=A0ABM9NHY3_9GAMM